ncbi:PREDICTED: heparan-sulfate 6-O-sulfotransferase 2-like [Priapulus caudatus]|uniref:Heparan-sulfate 6-O-sulfotransferase n=1 Tax=Priapulus caudatus TaxID=37621 RepID=A0ABM1EJV6_PRICU|nr:PREDICTED: heparan-sulfate 6-O-sulfotransferase 2-like [Priapulus caudatus]
MTPAAASQASKSKLATSRWKVVFALLLLLCTFVFCYFTFVCSPYKRWRHFTLTPPQLSQRTRLMSRHGGPLNGSFYMPANMHRGPPPLDYKFDMNGSDVVVFLHMQKTSGTVFGRHLVHHMDLDEPCQCTEGTKRCRCLRPQTTNKHWLFSRFSTGWKCGLHADWTELSTCVDDVMNTKVEGSIASRRYFYVTILREPMSRLISEFRHVRRGATWNKSRHMCNGRYPTADELPPCYKTDVWEDVTLDAFLACESNLAFNRQTRMLADLRLVGCYDRDAMTTDERDGVMLASAKHNLDNLAFFGLAEQQELTQFLFQQTFKLRFTVVFAQADSSKSANTPVTHAQSERIRSRNVLDVELYRHAERVFAARVAAMTAQFPAEYERFVKEVNGESEMEFPDGGSFAKMSHRTKSGH